MCASSVGPRVCVIRVLSNASSFFSNRNTITPPPNSENSDLGKVINERKKPEMYDLKGVLIIARRKIAMLKMMNLIPMHFQCTAHGLVRPESLTSIQSRESPITSLKAGLAVTALQGPSILYTNPPRTNSGYILQWC